MIRAQAYFAKARKAYIDDGEKNDCYRHYVKPATVCNNDALQVSEKSISGLWRY